MTPRRAQRATRGWFLVAMAFLVAAGWELSSQGVGLFNGALAGAFVYAIVRAGYWQGWRAGRKVGMDLTEEIDRLGRDPVV